MKGTEDMLQKREGETLNSRSTPSIIIEESQTPGPVPISNAPESCAPLEKGGFLDLEESSSRATNNYSAGNSQSTSSGVVSVNMMPRAVKRGAARKAKQHDKQDDSVAISEDMEDITDTAFASPGAVSVEGIGSSSHNDSALEDHQDQNDRGNDMVPDIENDPHDLTPSLIVTARLVSENPLMPEFLEEHLERRIQEGVESRLRAQHHDQHSGPPQPPVITTVVAEPMAPANPTSQGSNKENLANPSEASSRKVCGLQPLLLVLAALAVAGAITGVFLAMNQPTQTTLDKTTRPTETTPPTPAVSTQTTAPTRPTPVIAPTFITTAGSPHPLASLQPWLVRSKYDLPVFEDPQSPQARALDWLSLSIDSNNISDSGPTAIVLERYAVAVFYYSTNGPNWFIEGYDFPLMTADVCSWNNDTTASFGFDLVRGVICGNQSNVESIWLDQGLAGTIPWELSLLSDLSYLSLSSNTLSGTIPTELGKLTRLQIMYIYQNRLDGTLPSEMGRLTALSSLWFGSNGLTGSIPSEVGHLTALTFLDTSSNSFRGTVPTELGQLDQLLYLHFENNSLQGTIPTEFGLLTGLEVLWLGTNSLTGTLPSELGLLTGLENIWLGANSLTGTLPTEMGKLTMLEELYVQKNRLTGSVPMSLSALSTLTSFSLHENDLTGSVNDLFCTNGKEWYVLESDCLPTNGVSEIECDCCTSCCNAMKCQEMM